MRIYFIFVVLFVACVPLNVPIYHGRKVDYFNGEQFTNTWPTSHKQKSFAQFLKWKLHSKKSAWPEWVDQPYGTKPPERVENGIRITFVGHASFLIQVDGLNILTDPVWSKAVGVFAGYEFVKRHKNPGLRFEDLPPIYWILISHNHFDHMDLPTLSRLASEKGARTIAGLGNAEYLQLQSIKNSEDIGWWQEKPLNDRVSVVGVPAQHWSMRWLNDRNRSLWLGFVLKTKCCGQIYFAGDTGFGAHIQMIRDKLGPMNIAFLPIGSYEPRWFMSFQHMNPEESLQTFELLNAKHFIPMHYGTFCQSDEAYDQPVKDLETARAKLNIAPKKIHVLKEGEFWQSEGHKTHNSY